MAGIMQWLEKLLLSGLTLAKVLFLSEPGLKIPGKTSGKPLIILGNGPSLTSQISGIVDSEPYDFLSVNYFPLTELYKKLKPCIHVMLAPEYFIDDVSMHYVTSRRSLFKTLNEETTWPIKLFIPTLAKKHKSIYKDVLNNKNIQIKYFNTTPAEGFNEIVFWLMKNNLGMPRPHNVLIPSIILALNMGYKKIMLMGADHSWLKDLWVDENNKVLLTQKHFYDEETAKARPMLKRGKDGERRLHEVLHKFYISFQGYFLIRGYSSKLHGEIINLTKGSYIDAFERGHKLIE